MAARISAFDVTLSSLLQRYNLTGEAINQQVSDVHLVTIPQYHARHWRRLPVFLGLAETVANDIDRRQVEESEKRREFFITWRDTIGSAATYQILIIAMLRTDSRDDAEYVCQLLQESSQVAPSIETPTCNTAGAVTHRNKFPFLNAENMTEEERDRLITRLIIESGDMVNKFTILVDKTKESLEKQKLLPRDLENLINHSESRHLAKTVFKKCRNIAKLFNQLCEYWSFFDYELLRLIINRHCPKLKSELDDYEADFRRYCQRRICELPIDVFKTNCNAGHMNKNKLYIKTDKYFDQLTIDQIKRLEYRVSTLLDIDLYLLSYREGCVELEFQSSRDLNEVFPLNENQQYVVELRNIGVTEVKFCKFSFSTIDPGDSISLGNVNSPPVSLTPFLFTMTSVSRTAPSKLCSRSAQFKKPKTSLPHSMTNIKFVLTPIIEAELIMGPMITEANNQKKLSAPVLSAQSANFATSPVESVTVSGMELDADTKKLTLLDKEKLQVWPTAGRNPIKSELSSGHVQVLVSHTREGSKAAPAPISSLPPSSADQAKTVLLPDTAIIPSSPAQHKHIQRKQKCTPDEVHVPVSKKAKLSHEVSCNQSSLPVTSMYPGVTSRNVVKTSVPELAGILESSLDLESFPVLCAVPSLQKSAKPVEAKASVIVSNPVTSMACPVPAKRPRSQSSGDDIPSAKRSQTASSLEASSQKPVPVTHSINAQESFLKGSSAPAKVETDDCPFEKKLLENRTTAVKSAESKLSVSSNTTTVLSGGTLTTVCTSNLTGSSKSNLLPEESVSHKPHIAKSHSNSNKSHDSPPDQSKASCTVTSESVSSSNAKGVSTNAVTTPLTSPMSIYQTIQKYIDVLNFPLVPNSTHSTTVPTSLTRVSQAHQKGHQVLVSLASSQSVSAATPMALSQADQQNLVSNTVPLPLPSRNASTTGRTRVSLPSSSTLVSSSSAATKLLSTVAQAGRKTISFMSSSTAVVQVATSMPSESSPSALKPSPTTLIASTTSPRLAALLPTAALSNVSTSSIKLPSTSSLEPVATAKSALPHSTTTVSSLSVQEVPSYRSSTTSHDSAIGSDQISLPTQGPESSSFRASSRLTDIGHRLSSDSRGSLDSAIEADLISPSTQDYANEGTSAAHDPETEDEIEAEFQRGLANGFVKLHITKCGVSGPPDTGKSHLRALMLGLPRPKQRRSTALATEADQATPDYSRFVDEDVVDVRKTGKGVMWRVIKNDSMARVIANTLHNEDYSMTNEESQVSKSHEKSQQLRKKYKIILETKKHLRRMKGKPKRRRKGLNGIHLVYFVDTGGQPQFQEILPNFIKCDVNLLVHNMFQRLDYCPEFNYIVDGKKYSVPEQMRMSNISIIEQSVRSITSSIVSVQQKPHVAIIGTFKDKCNPGSASYTDMLRVKSKEINEHLKPYTGTSIGKCDVLSPQRNIEQRIFAVDGSEAGWIEDQESLEKLKGLILSCSEKRPVEVPIKYFIFLQNLLEYANKDSLQYVTLADCQYVASTSNISMNTTDVHAALKLFSSCNIILFYPTILGNFVFIKPGFLFGKVTDLIVASFHCESDLMPDCRAAFQKTGVFNSQILDEIRLPDGKFSKSDFLALLKGLFIIADLSNGSYFMPCVLPPVESSMSTEMQEYKTCMKESGIDGPLVLSFTNGMSPRGLFCSLLVALAKNSSWSLKNSYHTEIFRHRNLIEFEYYTPTEHNSVGHVVILDKQSHLEVYTTCEKQHCSAIRIAICKSLNSACDGMDYNQDHLYNTGFICRMDCGHATEHYTNITQDVLKERCLLNLRKRAVELSLDRAIWFQESASHSSASHNVGPSVMLLCKEVATRTNQWEQIALGLGLSWVDIERIKMENSGVIMACFTKVFEKWHKTCIQPKWTTIIGALELEFVREIALAQELRSKYL